MRANVARPFSKRDAPLRWANTRRERGAPSGGVRRCADGRRCYSCYRPWTCWPVNGGRWADGGSRASSDERRTVPRSRVMAVPSDRRPIDSAEGNSVVQIDECDLENVYAVRRAAQINAIIFICFARASYGVSVLDVDNNKFVIVVFNVRPPNRNARHTDDRLSVVHIDNNAPIYYFTRTYGIRRCHRCHRCCCCCCCRRAHRDTARHGLSLITLSVVISGTR